MITANFFLFGIDLFYLICFQTFFSFFYSTPMACALMENLGLLKEKLNKLIDVHVRNPGGGGERAHWPNG